MEVARHLLSIAMASHWLLLILFVTMMVHAVFPVVPSSGMVVTASMAAAAGRQNLLVVIAVALCGSLIGESVCYLIGRGSGPAVDRWMARQERRKRIYERVSGTLHRRGGLILLTVRYLPGARMAATLTAGATGYSYKKFIAYTALGVTIACTYVSLVGYFGGGAFAHDQLKALAFSLSLAAALGLVVGAVRRIANWRRAAKVTGA